MGKNLKGIGYWREESGIEVSLLQRMMYFLKIPVNIKSKFIHEYAEPQKMVGSGLSLDEKAELVNYLRSGKIYAKWLGFSHCRFNCGAPDSSMGALDLSDGHWVWPEGLAHYVEEHDVMLPDEFILHAKNSKFKIADDIKLLSDTPIDMGFWDSWCKEIKN